MYLESNEFIFFVKVFITVKVIFIIFKVFFTIYKVFRFIFTIFNIGKEFFENFINVIYIKCVCIYGIIYFFAI